MKLRHALSVLSLLSMVPLLVSACGDEPKPDQDASDGGGRGGGSSKDDSSDPPGERDEEGSERACVSDKQCSSSDQLCHQELLVCVDCLSDVDCGKNAACENFVCESYTACTSSKQCGEDQVCDTSIERCVECTGDNDCGSDQICAQNRCKNTCSSDKTCRSEGKICHPEGYCTECVTSDDCGSRERCSDRGECVARVCGVDAGRCAGDDLLICNAEGSGFDSVTCSEGCSERGGAHCVEDEEVPGDTDCASAVSNMCAPLRKLTNKRVIDGKADEFCTIPPRQFNLKGSRKATARVAWRDEGLHLHVHVEDPEIRLLSSSYSLYDMDNVQLFLVPGPRSAVPVGHRAEEGGNQIAMTPPQGETAAKLETYYSNVGNALGAEKYEFAARQVSGGYEVELYWMWPGAVKSGVAYPLPVKGDKISFDIKVGVLDEGDSVKADFPMYINPDVDTATDSLWCTNAGDLYCNVERWCESTLQ